MKAYKITRPYSKFTENLVGRIIVQIYDESSATNFRTVLLANYTDPQTFIAGETLRTLIKDDKVDEINLEDETWIHPHLYKPIKNIIYNK